MARPEDRPPVSDSYAQGESALRDLREPLRRWLDLNAEVDEEVGVDAILEALTVATGGLLTVRPQVTLTRQSPEDVEALLARVIPAMVSDVGTPDPAEMQQDLQQLWLTFLTFLGDTGRWAGSRGDLETCLSLLAGDPPEVTAVLAQAAAGVDEGEEDATVLASFPVRAAMAVLAHVGDGLVVPDDEELSADDVTAVLAGFEHPVTPEVGEDGEPLHLEDLPWLRQVVLTMLGLDLLNGDDDTLLVPGEEAATWLEPTPEPRELRRHLVGGFLLDDPSALDGGFSISEAVLPTVFASAMVGQPFDDAMLEELVDGAAGLGPAAAVAVGELRERLTELGAFGLVSPSAPWTVERGYWPAIAAAAEEEDDGPLGDLFGGEEPPHWFDSVLGQLGVGDDQAQQIRGMFGGR